MDVTLSLSSLEEHEPFGQNMLRHFKLQDGYINMNHGSFGVAPKVVSEYRRSLEDLAESSPDRWFRGGYQRYLSQTRQSIAKYVNASDSADIVFVENASSGVNSILRSLTLTPNDAILFSNYNYAMVKYTLTYVQERYGCSLLTVNLPFPVEDEREIVDAYRHALDSHPSIKMVVLDHVSSLPAIVFPVEKLTAMFKEKGVLVLIDGAHAPGMVDVDLQAINADFYVANCHKWLYSPKGAAIMWVRKELQPLLVPTVISSTGKLDFIGAFEYTGTRDYTPFLATTAALEFRHRLGEKRIKEYMHELGVWAGRTLAELWNTEVGAPDSMTGALVMVRLPITDDAFGAAFSQRVLDDYDIFLVVSQINGHWWLRLSAQIYLEQADFLKVGKLIQSICATQPKKVLAVSS